MVDFRAVGRVVADFAFAPDDPVVPFCARTEAETETKAARVTVTRRRTPIRVRFREITMSDVATGVPGTESRAGHDRATAEPARNG